MRAICRRTSPPPGSVSSREHRAHPLPCADVGAGSRLPQCSGRLLGDIEQALVNFQKAMDLALGYDDAAINYRELLSRLVQRRVAQWQSEQAEMMLSEAERKAARYAKRAKKFSLGRLLRPGQSAA